MGFDFTWYPAYLTTYRNFEAADPWQEGRATTWNVNLYWMAITEVDDEPFTITSEKPAKVPPPHARVKTIGIAATDDRRYHMAPVVLRDLWLQGNVKDEDLPRLIHEIEGPLHLRRYVSSARQMMTIYPWAMALGATLIGMMGAAFLAFAADKDVGWGGMGIAAGLLVLGLVPAVVFRRNERTLTTEVMRRLR